MIVFIVSLFQKMLTVFGNIASMAIDNAEAGFRAPLQQVGIGGVAATLLLALIPLTTMIVSMKMLRGVVRLLLVACTLGTFIRVAWPLFGHVSGSI